MRDGKRTWIGSDTQAEAGGTRLSVEQKWVRFGTWALGIAGDRRVQCICEAHAKRLFDDLPGAFDFTERFYDLLKEYDFDLSPSPGDSCPVTGQNLILANPSELWTVLGCLAPIPVELWADGSGRNFGLGAMHAMRGIDDAERVLKAGLAAAFEYDAGTGGEIWTDVLES